MNRTALLLTASFLTIIAWFQHANVYHLSFFSSGTDILIYNICRTIFTLFILWIIYALGYLSSQKFISANELSLLDSTILFFGIGIGLAQVALLLLGLANLYYLPVALVLCLAILFLSAVQFRHFCSELKLQINKQWQNNKLIFTGTTSVTLFFLAWLLLARGLYPAGGHDYYTHYFYYYLNVINHHGLTPNDVWYHYFYSKGAGLFFLGMLLTDPLAPSLITYGCVLMASLAIISLMNRTTPRSFWPLFCAILYIAYNLAALNGTDGGEFQKIHEVTSALTVLMLWGISMLACWPTKQRRAAFIMIVSVTIAASIFTQATGIFFGVYFAVLACAAWIQHQKQLARQFFLLLTIAIAAVCMIFILNYLVVGIPSDQSLSLMWKIANVERLNQLGLLPNILVAAWVRENYAHVANPWGMETLHQLIAYLRAGALKVGIMSLIIPVIIYSWSKPAISIVNRQVFYYFALALAVFGSLAILLGHSQTVSFLRYSSFFFPMMTIMIAICWSLITPTAIAPLWMKRVFLLLIPLFLLVGVIHSWNHWTKLMQPITANSVQFATGQFSIADAYTHEPTGYSFGGINPGAWQAIQHVPAHARVWSTNVASYCMAPDCQIESVISFKLSSRMNDIINGTPEQTKSILQQEKLNYFIFSDEYPLRDLLIYSELFQPKNILRDIAVCWTDGKTYLLTWRTGPVSTEDRAFLQAYMKHYAVDDDPSFKFSNTLPVLKQFMQSLETTPHPWRAIPFPWQQVTKQNQTT